MQAMRIRTATKQKKRLNDLARRIRSARLEAHMSQHGLGKSIGVSDKSVSAYEQGRSTPPFAKLKKIADATSHPLAYFTDENITEATITSKILMIERELAEVKKLLKKSTK